MLFPFSILFETGDTQVEHDCPCRNCVATINNTYNCLEIRVVILYSNYKNHITNWQHFALSVGLLCSLFRHRPTYLCQIHHAKGYGSWLSGRQQSNCDYRISGSLLSMGKLFCFSFLLGCDPDCRSGADWKHRAIISLLSLPAVGHLCFYIHLQSIVIYAIFFILVNIVRSIMLIVKRNNTTRVEGEISTFNLFQVSYFSRFLPEYLHLVNVVDYFVEHSFYTMKRARCQISVPCIIIACEKYISLIDYGRLC